MIRLIKLLLFIFLIYPTFNFANNTTYAVWANEAIVATYTYDYANFIQRQKEIAHYFTAAAWTSYSTALNASKLPLAVQKNKYEVSAVATLPPELKQIGKGAWQATMPILVIFKNPQYQQKQNLEVTIHFGQAPNGQGIRGLAINLLQAKIITPPCECKENDEQQSPHAAQSTPPITQ